LEVKPVDLSSRGTLLSPIEKSVSTFCIFVVVVVSSVLVEEGFAVEVKLLFLP